MYGETQLFSQQFVVLFEKGRLIIAILCCAFIIIACSSSDSSAQSGASDGTSGSSGRGGSMARFSIVDDQLLTIAGSNVHIFDISHAEQPELQNSVEVAWDIETLFPYENYLFIGSETGVHIYDISELPAMTYVSQLSHVQSCDPVVVRGTYAYVTLRSSGFCAGGAADELLVIDISNIRQPQIVEILSMNGPLGLGIDETKLFVCDGTAGLKFYDISNPVYPDYRGVLPEQQCYDVIPNDGYLIVSGAAGLYQYATGGFALAQISALLREHTEFSSVL